MGKIKKSIYLLVMGIFLCGIIYSAYQLLVSNQEYAKEEKVHQELLEYKPRPPINDTKLWEEQPKDDTTDNKDVTAETIVNQSIIDLQKKNADVIGWITIPGTQIDYPFLWADDYDKYLRTDINGNKSTAGSIFMDYRCDRSLKGAHSILFGHNMNNDSMFGSLPYFRDRAFFLKHREGYVYLPNENLKLQAIACMIVESSDVEVYGVAEDDKQKENFIELLKKKNIHSNETIPEDLMIRDMFLILSTCSYEHSEARTVVVYRIVN